MALCIPDYGWVPGLSGPPDWFSGGAGQNTSISDPRWVGALRVSKDAGGGEKFTVRAVRETATNRLFLSVLVLYDTSSAFDINDQLWIGLKSGVPGVAARMLRLNYTETAEAPPPPPASTDLTIASFTHTGGTTWTADGGPPTWLSQTCVWRWINTEFTPNKRAWAFQMVINTAPAGANLTDATHPEFGLCFQARIEPAALPDPPVVYRYPDTMPVIVTSLGTSGLSTTSDHWATFAFAGAAGAVCDGGVWISPDRIGTTNTPTHQIKRFTPNRLQARPRNDSGAEVNIRAHFRLANWGSAPEHNWRRIRSDPANDNGTVAASSDGDLQNVWQPNASVSVPLPGGGTQDEVTFYTNHWHQCMQVELEAVSGTVYFSRSSCVRNMDFIAASKFTRLAEISVRNLSDGFPKANRDVYVYVERLNMPVRIDGNTREKYQQVQDTYRDISDIGGDEISQEERYVAIIEGDLRHLRYIDVGSAIEWTLYALEKKELLVRPELAEILHRLGFEGGDYADIINNYSEKIHAWHANLTYDDNGQPQIDQRQMSLIRAILDHVIYQGQVTAPAPQYPPLEELETYIPAVRYHVFHDTGLRSERNGVWRPIIAPQPSFGYYVWLDHDVEQWELRLQGAQKLSDNLYLIQPPTEGEVNVTTVIHAVDTGEEGQIDPREEIVRPPVYQDDVRKEGDSRPKPSGCLELIAQALENAGPIGKLLAQVVRSFGGGSA